MRGVTTHIRDYPVECGTLVAKAMLTGGKLAEVLSSLGNSLVVEFEDNPPSRLRIDSNVKLHGRQSSSEGRALRVDSRRRCVYTGRNSKGGELTRRGVIYIPCSCRGGRRESSKEGGHFC